MSRRQRVTRSRASLNAQRLGLDLSGQRGELLIARNERREVEAEREADVPPLPFRA